jgi:histidine triad (HIT) family protein
MHNDDCLLCAIARGKMPAAKTLLANEHAMAVLNTREPQATGHIVVFPRRHAIALHDMDHEGTVDVFDLIRRLARDLRLENYNVLHNAGAIAGQTVLHAHVHLIPKTGPDEGLRFTWATDLRFDPQASYEAMRLLIREA